MKNIKIYDTKPQVGIFEIIDNKIYVITRDVDYSKLNSISDDAGEFFHEDLVRNVINQCSKEAQAKYKSVKQGFLVFPRGRVVYSFRENLYQIFGPRAALTSSNIETIMRLFSLPRNKVKAYVDPYYDVR